LVLVNVDKDICFTGEIVFFGGTLVIYIVFINLAREWPKVMGKWELMEREMKEYGYPSNMAFKVKMLTWIIVLLSTSTYNVIRITQKKYKTLKHIISCNAMLK